MTAIEVSDITEPDLCDATALNFNLSNITEIEVSGMTDRSQCYD